MLDSDLWPFFSKTIFKIQNVGERNFVCFIALIIKTQNVKKHLLFLKTIQHIKAHRRKAELSYPYLLITKMLNYFAETWIFTYQYILLHFPTLKCHMLFGLILDEDQNIVISQSLFHDFWWPGDRPGGRPSNDISIEFEFGPKFAVPGLKYTLLITRKFCTHHDSYTVVTCAKFCSDCLSVRKVSNIRFTKCQNLKDSRLVLQLSVPNPLKPSVKSVMKMKLEQRRQAMLQLHLSYRQFYCQLRCHLY